MLILILFISALAFYNYRKATSYNLSGKKYALNTVIFVMLGFLLASFLLSMILLYQNPELVSLMGKQEDYRPALKSAIEKRIELYSLLIMMGGIGGQLFILSRIQKRARMNEPQ